MPHLLRHGTSVFKVISQRLVILTSKCRALCEGAIITYFKRLRPYKINSLVLRPFFPMFDVGGRCFFFPFLRRIEMMREGFFFNITKI
jgi:hypothetical protein